MAGRALNVKFAVDCLVQNEWDVDKAVANFEQVKVGLHAVLVLADLE